MTIQFSNPERDLRRQRAICACALVMALWTCAAQAQQVAPPDAPFVQTYQVAPAEAQRLQPLLRELANGQPVREFYDGSSQQWVVIAPRTIHDRIRSELAATDTKAHPGDGPQLAPLPATPPVAADISKLTTLDAHSLHKRLEQVLNRKLTQESGPLGVGIVIENRDTPPVKIWINDAFKAIRIEGTAAQVKSWNQIVQALDTPTGSEKVVIREKVPAGKLREAVAVLNGATPAKTVQAEVPAGEQPGVPSRTDQNSPLGPVRVDVVEGTDSLMLRGSPEDVERVLKIIEEIEEMEQLPEPVIEVVTLHHIDSQALSTLLLQVTQELSTRYGFGSIIAVPLVNPNAVLLVGLPASVERAKAIIQRLDQPTPKEFMQFEVFRLKNAKAADALPVVESLFTIEEGAETVPGLASRAQIFADSRLNALVVRANPRDMAEIRALISEIDQQASDSVNEIRVFKLKNTVAADLGEVLQDAFTPGDNANNAANLSRLLKMVTIDSAGRKRLESGVLTGSKITAAPSANALIVTALPESMPLLENLISQLDQSPDAGVELKIFSLKNGDAVALAATLEQLFATGGEDGGDSDQPRSLSALRVQVDERTNSIIAAGTLDDLLVVEAIVLRLDATDARDRQNHVYRLNNKSAEEVAQALNDWLRAERDVQGTAPGTASPFQQIEREVVVVPEMASNSLIVSATPRYYDEIARLVRELDAQEPMVMVQVLIGEVELGDADEFGVELGLQDSVLFDRSLLSDLQQTTTTTITTQPGGGSTQVQQQVIQSANQNPGFNFGNPGNPLGNSGSTRSLATAGAVGAQGLANFAMQRVNPDLGFGGMVLSASSDSVSALLRALQETRHLEILSRPQIMALNNQEGTAFVGQSVPFIVESDVNLAGVRTNAIDFREVGLGLTVVPRISPDGLVVMNVVAEKSELGSVADGVPVSIAPNGDAINAPIIALTRATTTVSAASGQTVVLSGLLTKRDFALHRRVPIIADIPLLGSLFRFDSTSTKRTELLIILTPHVVNNRFESEMLKQVESARMNWCLSDVVEMHGPVGLRSQQDLMGEAESEVVYPEQVREEELLPVPEMAPLQQPIEVSPPQEVPLPPQTEERSALRFPFSMGKSTKTTATNKK
jgi:type II secretory pathway component GspD/PulD (secretin)